jgi:uncharacterized protein
MLLGLPTANDGVVRRRIEAGNTASLRRDGSGRLSGHLGETPQDFGLHYQSHEISGQRLWRIEGRGRERNVWVIHVHGLGSKRSQVLRGVAVFSSLGFTSLVPTYRTSLDAGQDLPPQSHLGLTEWADIAQAQEYALKSGAEKIIYVGWSLGASLALQTIHRVPRPEVLGAVLVAPALDWRSIILARLSSLHVPRPLARWALSGFNLGRKNGDPRIRWERLPGASVKTDPKLPTLIFHGIADSSVPARLSRDLAERWGEDTVLVEFPDAHHTLEFNSDPALWERSVRSWCVSLGLLDIRNNPTTTLEKA